MIKDYNPTSVKELDFEDPHGNKGYNVFFENEDKPVFMMAKRAPEVGNVEYGQIVDTPKKSGEGTYRKFKREQREEGQPTPVEVSEPKTGETIVRATFVDRDEAITRQSALKSAVATGEKDLDKIIGMADDFLVWLKNEPEQKEVPEIDDKISDEPLPEPQGEVVTIDESEINLDDIPF